MDFNEKMNELEKILKNMENDTLSLDTALENYEHGIQLVRECRSYLEDAQKKISILSKEGEEIPLKAAEKENKGNNNNE